MAYGETELFIVRGGPSGPGGQGKDGASAFESWLLEQGITDTPETHDANWQAYMDAIKGAPGEDGTEGPSVFEDWCTHEQKDPNDPASWETFIASLTAGVSGRVGEIIAAMSEEQVQGALLCDGATYSKNDYIMLYTFLETNVPALIVDDNNFQVPDLRGEFLRGLDKGRGVDPDRVLGSEQDDALQNITGGSQAVLQYVTAVQQFGALFSVGGATPGSGNTGTRAVPASGTNTSWDTGQINIDASRVARTADETRPTNVAINYYIRYTTVTGNEVEQGPAGPQGDDAFVTWCKEHDIDPTDPAAWEDYMLAIKGDKGDKGDAVTGPTGKSAYEEYKETHPSASYEDWLRVVTAAFSVPLVDAVVGGPSVKIPQIHPLSRKPIYRKYVDLGKPDQYTFTSGAYAYTPLSDALGVDVALLEDAYVNNGLSFVAYLDLPGSDIQPPLIVLADASAAAGARGVTVAVQVYLNQIEIACSTTYRSNRSITACIEYTLKTDQPIEFPIWTQKEGWISPPGYIGEIVATFDTDPEPGTLVCDGSLLERIDYPSLYDFLQLKIPALIVDADTFNLPDLRGEFLRGVDSTRTVGSHQDDALQNITGSMDIRSTSGSGTIGSMISSGTGAFFNRLNASTNPANSTIPYASPGVADIPDTFNIDVSRVARTANETRPVNTAVTYCIRYMNTFDPSGGGQMPIGSVEVIEDEVVIP